ncbi:MAG: AAA family ATPase [Vitreoscilla sp.]|nr:AAA family ATPase [Vitreoscilla sp.]
MKLALERLQVTALVEAFPRLAHLQDQLRFGHRIELPHHQLNLDELLFVGNLYAAAGADASGRLSQLRSLLAALQDSGERFDADADLEQLLPALAHYLATDPQRGWLFAANVAGKPMAWVVTRLDYVSPSNEEMGKVMVELKAMARIGITSQTLRITEADMRGHNVAEILAAKGWLKETAALIAEYDTTAERYFDWRARYGVQFSGTGTAFHAEDPSATHRDTDWSRKDQIVLSASGGAARLVNDEAILPPRATALDSTGDVLGAYLRKAAKSNRYAAEDEVEAERAAMPKGMFTQLPVHGYLFMFHLELHHHVWVHVDELQPYVYQPELKTKLVLPPEQTDLIDILTAEMDLLMDDIVAGKSGGTTVLCAGPPGVGKTLTAEVYAEIVGRPLYRVHSGQLGLNVASMETALKEALTRAQRWGAVMLIDEADVYIKRRDDNITMNAVVGVFLRVLEYFNGLLFLTTNRIADIDEAIVSRCIALIRYQAPDTAARERIWRVMAAQFGLALSNADFEHLASRFASASGRDIKGLAKLVAKYCHHKQIPPGPAVFERCAVFRGLDGKD